MVKSDLPTILLKDLWALEYFQGQEHNSCAINYKTIPHTNHKDLIMVRKYSSTVFSNNLIQAGLDCLGAEVQK